MMPWFGSLISTGLSKPKALIAEEVCTTYGKKKYIYTDREKPLYILVAMHTGAVSE
jgi:hypothetical protein